MYTFRNDSHPYIAPLRAGSAEEPEVYDDLDDNPQVYPREEYSELQETYDTVVNDRSEIEALGIDVGCAWETVNIDVERACEV